MIAGDRPVLSLADLEAFDPRALVHGAERRFCCPLPACAGKPLDAAHRSLAVNAASGLWKCYRCGATGKLREWWQSRRETTRATLARRFALPQKPVRRAEKPESGPTPVDVSAKVSEKASLDWRAVYAGAHGLGGHDPVARYLAERCIALTSAELAGVCAATVYGRPAALFPIRDQDGRLVALHARYADDGRAKPGALSKQTWGAVSAGVFATRRALNAPTLAVVEAPIDALSLAQCGVPAIALCGTGHGPDWLPQEMAFRRVWAAFDGDAAGDAAAKRLGRRLTLGTVVRRLRPDTAKDWNALLVAERLDPDALTAAVGLGATDWPVNGEGVYLCAAGCGHEHETWDSDGRPLCQRHVSAFSGPPCPGCDLPLGVVSADCPESDPRVCSGCGMTFGALHLDFQFDCSYCAGLVEMNAARVLGAVGTASAGGA